MPRTDPRTLQSSLEWAIARLREQKAAAPLELLGHRFIADEPSRRTLAALVAAAIAGAPLPATLPRPTADGGMVQLSREQLAQLLGAIALRDVVLETVACAKRAAAANGNLIGSELYCGW